MSEGTGLADALSGVTVVEFPGRSSAFAGYLLGQMGAHVIAVRTPTNAHDHSDFALAYDHGKQMIVVASEQYFDLTSPELAAAVHTADIVITDSVETGSEVISRERLHEKNSSVIHADISTFGRTGPKGARPGSDLIATAQSGFLHLTGTPGETPVRMGAEQAVKLGGAEAVSATMVALYTKERTGRGQHLDISVRDAMIRATVNAIPKAHYDGVVQQRTGDHWGVRDRPLKALWQCKDGWISFVRRGGALGGRVNESCIQWMNEAGIDTGDLSEVNWNLIDLGNDAHRQRIDQLDALFEGFLQGLDTQDVFEEGLLRGMTLAPVRDLSDVLAEPHLVGRDYWLERDIDGRIVRVPKFVVRTTTPVVQETEKAHV